MVIEHESRCPLRAAVDRKIDAAARRAVAVCNGSPLTLVGYDTVVGAVQQRLMHEERVILSQRLTGDVD